MSSCLGVVAGMQLIAGLLLAPSAVLLVGYAYCDIGQGFVSSILVGFALCCIGLLIGGEFNRFFLSLLLRSKKFINLRGKLSDKLKSAKGAGIARVGLIVLCFFPPLVIGFVVSTANRPLKTKVALLALTQLVSNIVAFGLIIGSELFYEAFHNSIFLQ